MNKILASMIVAMCAVAMTSQSARATILSYEANLTGPNESPINSSPGTGYGWLDYDDVAHTMHMSVVFSGLQGNTTASHIHSATAVAFTGTAGVATTTPTFAGFPVGVTAGSYEVTLNMLAASSYNNPTFINANGGTPASAELALFNGIAAGKAYLNIHSSVFGGGEIRDFWRPVVPEPSSLALLAMGALVLRRRRA